MPDLVIAVDRTRQQFEMQRQGILGNASTANVKGYKSRTVSQKDKRNYLAALLLWSTYNDTMRKALAPIIYALLVETGKQATAEVGLDPSMFNPTDLDVLNQPGAGTTDEIDPDAEVTPELQEQIDKQLEAAVANQ